MPAFPPYVIKQVRVGRHVVKVGVLDLTNAAIPEGEVTVRDVAGLAAAVGRRTGDRGLTRPGRPLGPGG